MLSVRQWLIQASHIVLLKILAEAAAEETGCPGVEVQLNGRLVVHHQQGSHTAEGKQAPSL